MEGVLVLALGAHNELLPTARSMLRLRRLGFHDNVLQPVRPVTLWSYLGVPAAVCEPFARSYVNLRLRIGIRAVARANRDEVATCARVHGLKHPSRVRH